ncbi:MAG: hypothetical protein GAK43_01087 [Stenotrophomonas maltophilia]|nr:MAG: hypothetical protein GAK43_01087 [Stenotrophomonas maltophilia]
MKGAARSGEQLQLPRRAGDTLVVERMFRGEIKHDRWLPPMLLDLPFSLVDTLLLLDALELSTGSCQQGAGDAEKRKAPEGALKIME